MVYQFLLAHGWSGCDTTSAVHQKGKIKVLQYLKSREFSNSVKQFGNMESSADDIKQAGIKMIMKL